MTKEVLWVTLFPQICGLIATDFEFLFFFLSSDITFSYFYSVGKFVYVRKYVGAKVESYIRSVLYR